MIYLVEDDDSIRELVLYTLNNAGYAAKGFAVPSLFWEAIEQELPQLILLDIMLPEEDGLSVLKRLRASVKTARMPVMMLTAKGTEYDKVIGLDYGADDYMPKPFGMMELLARIRALLRRASALDKQEEYRIGNLFLSVSKHIVSVDGTETALTLKEFELLALLMKQQGQVFTRDQLLSRIWGYGFDGENRTVDVHIRSLRQKLGACGHYVETVRGLGYKIGEVKDEE